MYFSIIIPVYNRPDEIKELLESLLQSTYTNDYEIVIVEDGSTITCEEVVAKYSNSLNISYYFKKNSGPGDSRNFGMQKANGDYFIIFDSDCIIPSQYLNEVEKELKSNYVDCFGGPDKALKSFSNIQKAINFAMTSFLTTGGIRGGSEKINKFQPRSFNMGISQKAFLDSKGFGNIHPGEDPDLSIRLWKLGYDTRLFTSAYVYHKRRIDWDKFSIQVSKFGKARPILNSWYPEYSKITYWFPSLFVLGFLVSFVLLFALFDWALKFYFAYFVLIFTVSSIQNRNPLIGILSVVAVWKQFFGYGFGFLKSFFKISILKKEPQVAFPELFFKINSNVDSTITSPIIPEIKQISSPISKSPFIVDEDFKNLNKPKIIGLTGGIGSGKTTVANYFQSKGIPVYISDVEAKKVMASPEIISQIVAIFGADILGENDTLNRDKLASIVFNNPDKLKQLNSIVHPAVKKHFEQWVGNNKNFPYLVKEAAILFESGSYKDCDAIITVCAPMETRINRVLERDASTREKVLQRINNQISDDERIAKSQYVITNENFDQTKIQMDNILNLLKDI
jgi:dephospho-CoA kinase